MISHELTILRAACPDGHMPQRKTRELKCQIEKMAEKKLIRYVRTKNHYIVTAKGRKRLKELERLSNHLSSKPTWVGTFFEILAVIRKRSDDPDTQLGALIASPENDIISIGYNGIARGVTPSLDMLERPAKYDYMVHAETNAILNAGRLGASTKGCTLYVEIYPCITCANFIIQAGIKKVIYKEMKTSSSNWEESWKKTQNLFEIKGLTVEQWNN